MKKINLIFNHSEFGEIEAVVSYWKHSEDDISISDAVLHLSPRDVLEVQKRLKEETGFSKNPDHEHDSWVDMNLEDNLCGTM
jgi:hypothetical protein